MASLSSHSIKRLATIADTGLPIAVPNICRYIWSLKLKYVVVRTKFKSSIMSSEFNLVRSFKVLSLSNHSLMMSRHLSMGLLMNRETTSCELKISRSCLLHCMRVRLRNGYTQAYEQIMQHRHTHKAVTGRVEAKKLLSRRRQSNYRSSWFIYLVFPVHVKPELVCCEWPSSHAS